MRLVVPNQNRICVRADKVDISAAAMKKDLIRTVSCVVDLACDVLEGIEAFCNLEFLIEVCLSENPGKSSRSVFHQLSQSPQMRLGKNDVHM